MNSDQIKHILESEIGSYIFLGVFPKDCLPNEIVPLPCCLIANTDPESKSGQHWVAFMFDAEGRGEYFDSYGNPPHLFPEFKHFISENSNDEYNWSQKKLQGPQSMSCGQYCVYYLCHRMMDISLQEIQDVFSKDRIMNDCLVADWVNYRYDIETLCHESDGNCQSCEMFNE